MLSLTERLQLLNAARDGVSISPARAEASDAQQRMLGSVELVLGFLVVATMLLWVYRISRNAHALGTEGLICSPGMSVGWFFVPLANMIVPYLVLRDLWKASGRGDAATWRQAPVSAILGTWWIACIVRGIMHYSPWPLLLGKQWAQLGSLDPLWLDSVREFSINLLIAELVQIAVAVLTIVVIVRLTDMQELRHAEHIDREEPEFAAVT
jgi:hypothetical protein